MITQTLSLREGNQVQKTALSLKWSRFKKCFKVLFLCLAVMISFTETTYAQEVGGEDVNLEGGQQALEDAAGDIGKYFGSIKIFIYAIAGIIALFGVARVYGKFSSGDPQAMSAAAQWFGALIFLVVGVTLVGKFFNIEETG